MTKVLIVSGIILFGCIAFVLWACFHSGKQRDIEWWDDGIYY